MRLPEKNHFIVLPAVLVATTLVVACSSSDNGGSDNVPVITDGEDPAEPAFDQSLFSEDSADVSNPLFVLTPGTTLTYEGINEDGEAERVDWNVSHLTRDVGWRGESHCGRARVYSGRDGRRGFRLVCPGQGWQRLVHG